MNSYRRSCLLTFAGSLAQALCVPAMAQQAADIAEQSATLVSNDQAGDAAAPQKATAAQTPSGANPDADLTDNQWHFYGTGYLWIPGIHGTVGVRGFDRNRRRHRPMRSRNCNRFGISQGI